MDLVQRYIAAVQRELPEPKRADIGRELKANILDEMDAQRGGQAPLTDQQVADVLRKMGDPRTVARQFSPPKPLVALSLMPSYVHTLYLVLGFLLVLHLVDSMNGLLSGVSIEVWRFSIGLLVGWIESSIVAFTMITLIYCAISQQPITATEARWDPLKLPTADASWQHIRKSDMVTDLVTHTFLFVVIMHPYLNLILHDRVIESVFSEQVQPLLFAFVPALVIGIALTFWQFHRRFWSKPMLQLNCAINVAYCGVLVWLAFNGPIFAMTMSPWDGRVSLESIEYSIRVTLLIIALFPAYEVVRDCRRLRHGMDQ